MAKEPSRSCSTLDPILKLGHVALVATNLTLQSLLNFWGHVNYHTSGLEERLCHANLVTLLLNLFEPLVQESRRPRVIALEAGDAPEVSACEGHSIRISQYIQEIVRCGE